MMHLQKLSIRAALLGVDFRQNPWTNLRAFQKTSDYPGALRSNQTYLFVSKRENQLVWVINESPIDAPHGIERHMIDFRLWRIDGGRWDPLMLTEYARRSGIDLQGVKEMRIRFAQYRNARLASERVQRQITREKKLQAEAELERRETKTPRRIIMDANHAY